MIIIHVLQQVLVAMVLMPKEVMMTITIVTATLTTDLHLLPLRAFTRNIDTDRTHQDMNRQEDLRVDQELEKDTVLAGIKDMLQ